MIRWLLASLLTVAAQGQTPTEALFREKLKAAGPRELIAVPDELLSFSEASLPKDQELVDGYRRQRDSQELLVGLDGTYGGGGFEHTDWWPNGSRLVELRLAPGETIAVKLVESRRKVKLSLQLPKEPGPMQEQILRLRRRPAEYQETGFKLRNTTSEPFAAKVWVLGRTGYPYRLEFSRMPPLRQSVPAESVAICRTQPPASMETATHCEKRRA